MCDLYTNRAFLERFRAGEPDALRAIYWKYVRKVERLLSVGFEVRGRGTRVSGVCNKPDDLADLVQEVFMRAFSEKGRRAYDGLRDYGPYLYAIARNALVDWVRSRIREVPVPWAELQAAIDATPVTEDPAPWEKPATMRVVDEYLARLPEQLCVVHRLRHQECLSQDETALHIGVSRQTLRTLEHRLQDGLEAALEVAGIRDESQSEFLQIRSDEMKVG
jgi:RNA polymerase sigma factor (sigma-70 family)